MHDEEGFHFFVGVGEYAEQGSDYKLSGEDAVYFANEPKSILIGPIIRITVF